MIFIVKATALFLCRILFYDMIMANISLRIPEIKIAENNRLS